MNEPLVHYVIVRRDLSIGQVCAQIVHAAGASIALKAGSSGRAPRSSNANAEVGGANPSQPAISTGSGVAEGFGPAGVIPAPRTILPSDTIAVVLSVGVVACLPRRHPATAK